VVEETGRVRDILEILRFEVWIRELAIKVFDPSVLINAHIGDTREFPAVVHSLSRRETGTPRVDQGMGNDHQAQVRQAKRILAVPPNPNGSKPGQLRMLKRHTDQTPRGRETIPISVLQPRFARLPAVRCEVARAGQTVDRVLQRVPRVIVRVPSVQILYSTLNAKLI
jgi:hypothetical protein